MHRNGRNACGFVLAVLGVTLAGCSRNIPSFDPTVIAPGKIPGIIRDLPAYAPFSLAGLAFYRDRLFVSSNVGLFVVKGGSVETLYQWETRSSVIEGPWLDFPDGALWVENFNNGWLTRLDASGWHRVQLPVSPMGYYMRGEVLTGFNGVSSKKFFWIVGGGFASRWQPTTGQWTLEPPPPAPQWSAIRAVGPVGDSLLYVVREGLEVIPPSPYSVYDREQNWRPIPIKVMDFAQAVTTTRAVYIRAADGNLFEVMGDVATSVKMPAPCEAIAITSTGQLLAAFTGRGIFVLADGGSDAGARTPGSWTWKQKASYPYDSTEGEHWGYLSERDGQIAYATTTVPHVALVNPSKTNYTGTTTNYSGTTALWVLHGTRLDRVTLR